MEACEPTQAGRAGYTAKVGRDWCIPQGADTVNAFRYGTSTGGVTTYPQLVTAGWSARGQIRTKPGEPIIADFTSDASTGPRIDLTNDGYITMVLPAATTESLDITRDLKAKYDLELVKPDGTVIRLARGDVVITPDYTRTEAS